MIEGLPESGWSEDDLIKMAEPFGFPSDIILAKQIGKVANKHNTNIGIGT